jgi:C-type mannose receptor
MVSEAHVLDLCCPGAGHSLTGWISGENLQGYIFWTGGYEADTDGWRWSDMSPFAYLNWDDGEPNNWDGWEDCMVILYGTGKVGKWNDMFCDRRYYFICEKAGES